VQVLERANDFGGVESNLVLVEALFLGKVVKETAAGFVVHHHVELAVALEGVVHLENEGMVHFQKDVFFELDVTEVVFLLQYLLVKHLHCEKRCHIFICALRFIGYPLRQLPGRQRRLVIRKVQALGARTVLQRAVAVGQSTDFLGLAHEVDLGIVAFSEETHNSDAF